MATEERKATLPGRAAATFRRLWRASLFLIVVMGAVAFVALFVGYETIGISELRASESARTIFFQIRLPRVLLGMLVGASLGAVGAALQALFRNPLAEPFTLGVSGGGALGATVAIALGLGTQVAGVPLIFVSAFLGAAAAVYVVYRLALTGTILLPGALLLAGVVLNLIAGASVLVIQYVTDYTRALQILRWMIGSLDVVGFGLIWRMLLFVLPGLVLLVAVTRDLHLLAVDEETAASLGVAVAGWKRPSTSLRVSSSG